MEIPRHWRLKAQRYRLEGPTCPACGQLIFPPRSVCTQSHCTKLIAADRLLLPTSLGLTNIELHIRYRIKEGIIG